MTNYVEDITEEKMVESAIADWKFYVNYIWDPFAVGYQSELEEYMMFGDMNKYDSRTGLLKE
ncbi:hypothetical protein C3744_20810 [Priestia megaterium]|uniref:Uncharacterized protein n=1 Tax=Priestia megaterium TaxID=1404 RepID=A0A3D8WXY5_PRIMG|nr:hypothetical protein [Priestia megaterium]MDH3173650.1 hypothetical protein [Priestia megaterium]RDZ11505.1 hypothetical protein C3744_20810 [Priestia megaterium]